MSSRASSTFLLGLLALVLAANAFAKKEALPEVTEDGLHLVPNTNMAVVYAKPGATLAGYHRVEVLEPQVAFKKNWERDRRTQSGGAMGISSSDIEKIKNRLAAEFSKVFRETLEKGGYPVVEEAGEDVLLLKPAIVNLDITAPDTMSAGRTRTYASSAGEMTLYVELYDSFTGDLIAKAIDRKSDKNSTYYTWANSVSNKAAADRAIKGWAEILVNALNAARNQPEQGATEE